MKILKLFLVILVIFSLDCWAETRAKKAQDRPNIIVKYTDDQGVWGYQLFESGGAKFETPNLDRLASEGISFTNGHSSYSVCTPSRYGLLMGRYNWRSWLKNWVLFENHPLLIDTNRLTMGKIFQNAGYRTGCVGKWHLGWGNSDGISMVKKSRGRLRLTRKRKMISVMRILKK